MPRLLKKSEFLNTPKVFDYIDTNNEKHQLNIEKDQMCYTYCQVPIIYTLSNKIGVEVFFNEGSKINFDSLSLDAETSTKMFNRTNKIKYIKVSIIK